jgi:hypothetical protein
MRQAASAGMNLKGAYVTDAIAWPPNDDDHVVREFVVTPGQWSSDLRSDCLVFGTNKNYVAQFKATFGYEPNFKVAMSTLSGVVFQLALQQAGSLEMDKIMESMFKFTSPTIAGRVRFSFQQRNIGRDPLLQQFQVTCIP